MHLFGQHKQHKCKPYFLLKLHLLIEHFLSLRVPLSLLPTRRNRRSRVPRRLFFRPHLPSTPMYDLSFPKKMNWIKSPPFWDTRMYGHLKLRSITDRYMLMSLFFWTYRWCGRYQDNLDEFLSHTTVQFLVDDTDVSQSNFLIQQYMSTNNWSCQRWTTLLTNWKAGYKVTLTIVYTISRPVSDGDKIYQPGDYRHDLLVTIKP